jgi:hypothetical protein
MAIVHLDLFGPGELKMYVILFITHHRYHSLTHLKTTDIEIQDIKIIKKNETRRKEHSV